MPNIRGNLISVKLLTERGYVVKFDERHCKINEGNIQVAVADTSNNLYKLRTPNRVCSTNNLNIHQWHSILGHRDIEVVKSLSAEKFVDGVQFDECTTDDCTRMFAAQCRRHRHRERGIC